MKLLISVVFGLGCASTIQANAAGVTGSWQFSKEVAYYGDVQNIKPPAHPSIQIVDDVMLLGPHCTISLKKNKYRADMVLQSFMKAGDTEQKLTDYFSKNLSFDLSKSKFHYSAEKESCNQLPVNFVFSDEKLVFVAGATIIAYTRSDGGVAQEPNPLLYGHKASHLPFNVTAYNNYCQSSFPKNVKTLKSSGKCSPLNTPYMVAEGDTDPLSQLIGHHNYYPDVKDSDYNNPLAKKLHPVFLVFQPMKNVVLVRFDDREGGDAYRREAGPGGFLAIKDGKVSDQLNEACDFDKDYFCLNEDGKKLYQLTEAGKFKKVK